MASLVKLSQVKSSLRVDGSDYDADLQWKMEQATEIVIDYLKKPDHEWTVDDVPGPISSAIILVVRALFDGEEAELLSALATGDTASPVVALLMRLRDPALA